MKFLFKLIFIPIFTILIIPLIFLAFLYKSVQIPIDDFGTGDPINLSDMINEQFDAFLLDNSHNAAFGLDIAQADANQILKSTFLGINPDYLNEDAEADDKNYVMKETLEGMPVGFGYQGSWVRFKDSKVEIESGIHLFYSNFTFKTRLLITFDVEITTNEVVLTLEKLNIGNLPLAWIFGVADWAVEKATGESIKTTIDNQLDGLATFDPKTREIRVDIQNLLESQFEDDPETLVLVNSLLAFVNENDLLSIGFEEGSFNAGLRLGKMWEDGFTPQSIPNHLKITSDGDLQSILASKASSLLLSTLSSSDSLFIDIDALTLNRIFEYFLRDMIVEDTVNVIQQQAILEGYTMRIMMPYIGMENSQFMVNIPLTITKDGSELTHSFESIIKISATTQIVGDDLRINLNVISAGNGVEPLTLEGEFLSSILALVGGDSEDSFIQDGAFVIEDFVSNLVSGTLSITGIQVVGSNLRMFIEFGDSELIGQIGAAVQEVLDVLNNPDYPEELATAIDNTLAALLDPELNPAEVEAALTNLIDTISTLDPADQQVLYDDLLAALENLEDFDYNDLFNLIP
jgi:hypothetical protein